MMRLSPVWRHEGPSRTPRLTSPSTFEHIRRLEGPVGPIETWSITNLRASAGGAASNARAHRKGTLRLHQPTIGWYALHVVQPSYHKLRASQRVPGAQVHYVRWYEWPIWSSIALSTVDDIGHWEWCTTLQGISCQPPWFDLVMVSSPPSKLHQFISQCFLGICWPLLIFYASEVEYKHLTKN